MVQHPRALFSGRAVAQQFHQSYSFFLATYDRNFQFRVIRRIHLDGPTAVDHVHIAGNKRRFVTGQIQRQCRYFLSFT